MNHQPKYFEIIDIATGLVLKTCKTRNGANRAADNRDRAHGAVKCIVKAIW